MTSGVELRAFGPLPGVAMTKDSETGSSLDEKDEQTTVLGAEKEEDASLVEKEDATQIAAFLRNLAESMNRRLQFSVDDQSGEVTIKVTNTETGEVIREIPNMDLGGISREQYDTGAGLIFSGVV